MDKEYEKILQDASLTPREVPAAIYNRVVATINERKNVRHLGFKDLFQVKYLAVAIVFVGVFGASNLYFQNTLSSEELYVSQLYLSDTSDYMISFDSLY